MSKKLLLLLIVAMILPISVKADFNYNVSGLPFNFTQNVSLSVPQEDVPTTITATYDGWLFGARTIAFENTTFQIINVIIDIPANVSDGHYTMLARFNSTQGKRLELGFIFDINTSKPSAVSNISVPGIQCDYSKNPPVCTFQIISTGIEPKKEVVTIYNQTPVISCQDLYGGDYSALSAKYKEVQAERDLKTAELTNMTKILQNGCKEEHTALQKCQHYATTRNACLQQEILLKECEDTKQVWHNYAVANLDVTPRGKYNTVLALLILVIIADFGLFAYAKIRKRFRGVG